MEWYESLFLQACGHVMTLTKVANRRAAQHALNLDTGSTYDLVEAYQRGVTLVFNTTELKQRFADGADCALLMLVNEHQFSSTLQDIKRQHDVVLSATLGTAVRSSEFATYHVDVAIIRATAASAIDIAH
ncbi:MULTISPECIES: hypothetical protein [Pseudomonas]|uniref:hypothetical protein n=1 Tax=Pseudomonas TaxID=286 RepID=UPI00049ABB68|nr:MULTISPECIES: hypothetical protein [Pseudomonas]AHZ76237.1 hypothetical protein DW66_1717 [Pseudomonas putida]WJM54999.1 hypothetical protein QUC26_07485 [Pseudomonas asiatica]